MTIPDEAPPPFAWSTGEAFLSSTVSWLRACVVNPRATRDDVARMIAAVAGEVRRALAGPRP